MKKFFLLLFATATAALAQVNIPWVDISGKPTAVDGTTTQAANTVYAGPASGAAAVPAMRPLVTADIASAAAPMVNPRGPRLAFTHDGSTAGIVSFTPAQGAGDFTLSSWVNWSGSGLNILWGRSSATPTATLFYVDSNAKVTMSNISGLVLASTRSLAAGLWYHVAYIRAASVGYIYIDGILDSSASDSTNYTQPSDIIGSYNNGLFMLGTWSGRYAYNRALSAGELLALYQEGAPRGTDYNSASNTALYTSDFSVDTSGWAEWAGGQGVMTPNIDGIAGQDNSLRISRGTTGAIQIRKSGGQLLTMQRFWRVAFDYYLDAASGPTTLYFGTVNSPFSGSSIVTLTEGVWTSATLTTSNPLVFDTIACSGALGVGKNLYLRNIRFFPLGLFAAHDLTQPGNGYQRRDMSGNKADLILPPSGVTYTLPGDAPNQVRASLTWAGTHEAKSLLGQVALPPKAVITSIITESSAVSTGSGLTVGSITTPALFVSTVAYTTARKVHTVLNGGVPAGSATNDLSLVVDPDTANFTGTVNIWINYVIAQ